MELIVDVLSGVEGGGIGGVGVKWLDMRKKWDWEGRVVRWK